MSEDNNPAAVIVADNPKPVMPGLGGTPVMQPAHPAPRTAEQVSADAKAEMDSFIGQESRDIDPDAEGEHAVEKPKKLADTARSVEEDNSRETPALQTEEDDDEEDDDEEVADGDDGDERDDDDEPKPKPRKPLTVSERIRQLTRGRGDAERRASAAEAENAELRERVEALERGEKPKPKAADKAAEKTDDGELKRPDAKDFKYGEVDPEYIEALTDYRVELKSREAEAKREKEAATERHAALVTELEGKRDKMAEAGVAEFGEAYMELVIDGAAKGDWVVSPIVAQLTLDSDVGYKVAHHLASHPKEAKKVFGLPPMQQAAYFGRLEERFLTAKAAPPREQQRDLRVPNPPKRPARGAGGQFTTQSDTTDFAAFEAMANRQNRG